MNESFPAVPDVLRGVRRSRTPRNTPAPVDRRRTSRRERRRHPPSQRTGHTVVIAVQRPSPRDVPGFRQAQEQILIQQFIPQIPVKRLHIHVLPGVDRLNASRTCARLLQSSTHRLGHELRPVAAANELRLAKGSAQLVGDTCLALLEHLAA